MSRSRKIGITYRQHLDVTPEVEREVLARAYRFVLDCYEKRKAAEATDDRIEKPEGPTRAE